ncbi:MAG: phosphoribosylanthranilate isomerase [Pseudomonadota bacterium]
MTVRVKICGITTKPMLEAALAVGADYIGFVFFPQSPRHIGIQQAGELIKHIPDTAKSVALLVNPADEDVLLIKDEVKPDMLQLHGNETPERVAEIKKLVSLPIIKAIGVSKADDINTAQPYQSITDMILFDAKPKKSDMSALPGGNGEMFDWDILRNNTIIDNFMLSGGLNPDNVSAAIAKTSAKAVDVSSGVETQPGHKDKDLIHKFVTTAKSVQNR